MVNVCALEKPEYSTYIGTPKSMVQTGTQHAYYTRSCNINEVALQRHITAVENFIANGSRPDLNPRISSHLYNVRDMYHGLKSGAIQQRYEEVFPGVTYDCIHLLEGIGCTASSKKYQCIYSLSNYFPELLAFLCEEDAEVLRAKLESNCIAQGVSLGDLSRALCNVEYPLMDTVSLKPLVGISGNLDALMSDILNYPEKCVFDAGNGKLDFTSPLYSVEDRITGVLAFQITCLEQYIINMIITNWRDNPVDGVLLTSKALSSLTFQAPTSTPLQTFGIRLGDYSSFELFPVVRKRGDYLSGIVEGWL